MKGKKRTYWNFKMYETDAFADYLEQMAENGWYLTGMPKRGLMEFEKGDPERRRYSVAVVPGSSEFDSGEREEVMRFREYCEEAGWHLQCGNHIWQVFYTTEENPVPIETDPQLKLKNIREAMFTLPMLIGVAAMDLMFVVGLFLLWKEPLRVMSSGKGLFSVLVLLFGVLLVTGVPVHDWFWCRRAEKRIEDGGEFPPTDFRQVQVRDILGLSFSLFFAASLCLAEGLEFTFRFAGTFAGISIAGFILAMVRERGNGTRGEKVRTYLVAAFVILFIFNSVLYRVTDSIFDNREESRAPLYAESTFPKILESLDYGTAELFMAADQKTMLAEYQKVYGYAISPEGKEIHVNMRRYASPLQGAIARTYEREYPLVLGNVWEVTEAIRREENGQTLVKYDYTPVEIEKAEGVVDDWPVPEPRSLYVSCTENEIISVSFDSEGDDRVLEALAGLR